MPAADASLVLAFTRPLAAAGIEYMVTGSVACILYGEPRLTHDVDLVVELKNDADAAAVERAFPLSDFYVPPLEVIRAENARGFRGHFNVIEHASGYKADFYLHGRDPLHAWAFPRRRRFPVAGTELVVAPPEYVIIRKLEFFREGRSEKHLLDIAGVLRVTPNIDVAEIERIAAQRGLADEWRLALTSP